MQVIIQAIVSTKVRPPYVGVTPVHGVAPLLAPLTVGSQPKILGLSPHMGISFFAY